MELNELIKSIAVSQEKAAELQADGVITEDEYSHMYDRLEDAKIYAVYLRSEHDR